MNRLSLRKNWLEVQDFKRTTDHFKGIYEVYLNAIKKNSKDHNMLAFGLENTRILTDYAQKSSLAQLQITLTQGHPLTLRIHEVQTNVD
jgi:hypothetical protein